jgi:SAM-dependent methyltransferase
MKPIAISRGVGVYARVIIAQCGGWGLAVLLMCLPLPPHTLPGWGVILVQMSGAAALTAALRCPAWWIPINFMFVPLLFAASRLRLPPWVWLAAFVTLALVYWNSFRAQVPLFLTNRATAAAVADLLPCGGVRVLDVGSGTGSFICALARLRSDAEITGIESAPLPFVLSWLRAREHPRVDVRRGDFFAAPWADHDLIYAFLSPTPMARVWDKARHEMRPGAILVSNSFSIPGREPDRIVEVADRRRTRLLIFNISPSDHD